MKLLSFEKTDATVCLYIEALRKKIENNAILQSKALNSNPESKALLADISQNDNLERMDQVIELAVFECYSMFADMLKSKACGVKRKTGSDENAYYCISLRLPIGYPESSLEAIAVQAQEYVICRALNDWCMIIAMPDIAAEWNSRCERCRGEISRMMSVRTKPIHHSHEA